MARKAFAQLHIVWDTPIPGPKGPSRIHSYLGHPVWSIITCSTWGCIKKHPEASVGSKYSSLQDFGQMCTCVTSFVGAALLAYLLPGAIQSADFDF